VRHRAAKSYTSHRWRREGMAVCVLEKDQEAALPSGEESSQKRFTK